MSDSDQQESISNTCDNSVINQPKLNGNGQVLYSVIPSGTMNVVAQSYGGPHGCCGGTQNSQIGYTGSQNKASPTYSYVLGGNQNSTTGYATGGYHNSIKGTQNFFGTYNTVNQSLNSGYGICSSTQPSASQPVSQPEKPVVENVILKNVKERTTDDSAGCRRIVLIIDESASMGGQRDEMIAGVNEMIRIQREFDPLRNHLVNFTIIKFDDLVQEIRDSTLQAIELLTQADYRPTGSTRLYDAIGQTIEKYKDEQNVVCCIATDGMENASRTFNRQKVQEMVTQMKEDSGWKFMYLSEDLDTFQQGNNLGMTNQAGTCYNAMGSKGGLYAMISSGQCNTVMAGYSRIVGGSDNSVISSEKTTDSQSSKDSAVISDGSNNEIIFSSKNTSISRGPNNSIVISPQNMSSEQKPQTFPTYSLMVGGSNNSVVATQTIVGDSNNSIVAHDSQSDSVCCAVNSSHLFDKSDFSSKPCPVTMVFSNHSKHSGTYGFTEISGENWVHKKLAHVTCCSGKL